MWARGLYVLVILFYLADFISCFHNRNQISCAADNATCLNTVACNGGSVDCSLKIDVEILKDCLREAGEDVRGGYGHGHGRRWPRHYGPGRGGGWGGKHNGNKKELDRLIALWKNSTSVLNISCCYGKGVRQIDGTNMIIPEYYIAAAKAKGVTEPRLTAYVDAVNKCAPTVTNCEIDQFQKCVNSTCLAALEATAETTTTTTSSTTTTVPTTSTTTLAGGAPPP